MASALRCLVVCAPWLMLLNDVDAWACDACRSLHARSWGASEVLGVLLLILAPAEDPSGCGAACCCAVAPVVRGLGRPNELPTTCLLTDLQDCHGAQQHMNVMTVKEEEESSCAMHREGLLCVAFKLPNIDITPTAWDSTVAVPGEYA
eukprot:scaffold220649_cov22-Tisochrysis_lutea.AAC.1